MPLITPEYMAIQKELHKGGKYGTGIESRACAARIRAIAEPGASVLDYGCGQGKLKTLLPEYDVREYDPCIEGKNGKPEPADFVVCSDVMEHIEPDCIDTVIHHIRSVTIRRLVLVIDCRPAKKKLSDGRNAHISLHPPAWWKEKFAPHFRLESWEAVQARGGGEGVFAVLEPTTVMGELNAVGVLPNEERNEYTLKNVGLTWKRINSSPLGDNGKTLIICGYGPSIGRTHKDILKQQHEFKAEIVSVSGCHDFLRKKGIKPHWHVECDPRPHKSKLMGKSRKGVKYLMASCCDPGFMRRLVDEGADIILWHLFNGPESFKIRDIPSERDQPLIPGGGSVLLRALVLFYFMGYRRFIVHGFDCSFADGKTHAASHPNKFKQHIKVRVEGTDDWYDTAPVMVTYARHMLKDLMKGRFPECQFAFCGEGLFQSMLRMSLDALNGAPKGGTRDYFHLTEEDVEPHEIYGKEHSGVAQAPDGVQAGSV